MTVLAVAAVSARMLVEAARADGFDVVALDLFGDADTRRACAAAGVQVVTADDLATAKRLKVAADVNAVPPEGIAGVGVMDDGRPLAGTSAVGIGALAVGNVKYQTQHRLLVQMQGAEKALVLSFPEAFAVAREFLVEKRAKDAAKAAAGQAAGKPA